MAVTVGPGYYDSTNNRARVDTRQVVLGAVPALILPESYHRLGAVICNPSAFTVYIGSRDKCDANNGHALPAGNSIAIGSSAEVYAMCPGNAPTITALEEVAV